MATTSIKMPKQSSTNGPARSNATIGLIVNPIAGMGGSVGLKGTDGKAAERARALGAKPTSAGRAAEFVAAVSNHEAVNWLSAPGSMGAEILADLDITHEVIGSAAKTTSAQDTIAIAQAMRDIGADLLAFVGGDGTARDMVDAVGVDVATIAVPAGVKVYSSVFAYDPRAAARLLDAYVQGADLVEEEVLDLDEAAYRHDAVKSCHYGFLLVPVAAELVQGGKESSDLSGQASENKQSIAASVVADMDPGTLYLLGTGTTVKFVANELGITKTLLGIDAVVNRELVGSDLNEHQILELLGRHSHAALILTPLGGNGFILGRGNKPLTPRVLRRVGIDNILIIANRDKLLGMPTLHVDTGDADLDQALAGYRPVIVGRGHEKLMRIS